MTQNLEEMLYRISSDDVRLAELEEWVYTTTELETFLTEDEYLKIISLDFSNKQALKLAADVLRAHIHAGHFQSWYLERVLKGIIDRHGDIREYLNKCYELYCAGFRFLEVLALRYGLRTIYPPNEYQATSWDQLSDSEKTKLVEDLYPRVSEEASRVLNLIADGQIALEDHGGSIWTPQYDDTSHGT